MSERSNFLRRRAGKVLETVTRGRRPSPPICSSSASCSTSRFDEVVKQTNVEQQNEFEQRNKRSAAQKTNQKTAETHRPNVVVDLTQTASVDLTQESEPEVVVYSWLSWAGRVGRGLERP